MALVLKNVYNDKLDNIVNKYNQACHITIKMKPVYAKYRNIKTLFGKSCVSNWSKEVFVTKKVRNTAL